MNPNEISLHSIQKVSKSIRKIMKRKGINQTVLASKTGIAYQHMHRIVNCKTPLYLDDAIKIANALGVTIDELVRGGEGK